MRPSSCFGIATCPSPCILYPDSNTLCKYYTSTVRFVHFCCTSVWSCFYGFCFSVPIILTYDTSYLARNVIVSCTVTRFPTFLQLSVRLYKVFSNLFIFSEKFLFKPEMLTQFICFYKNSESKAGYFLPFFHQWSLILDENLSFSKTSPIFGCTV